MALAGLLAHPARPRRDPGSPGPAGRPARPDRDHRRGVLPIRRGADPGRGARASLAAHDAPGTGSRARVAALVGARPGPGALAVLLSAVLGSVALATPPIPPVGMVTGLDRRARPAARRFTDSRSGGDTAARALGFDLDRPIRLRRARSVSRAFVRLGADEPAGTDPRRPTPMPVRRRRRSIRPPPRRLGPIRASWPSASR